MSSRWRDDWVNLHSDASFDDKPLFSEALCSNSKEIGKKMRKILSPLGDQGETSPLGGGDGVDLSLQKSKSQSGTGYSWYKTLNWEIDSVVETITQFPIKTKDFVWRNTNYIVDSKEYGEKLSLPLNGICKCFGKAPFVIGGRPGGFKVPTEFMITFIAWISKQWGFDLNPSSYVTVKGDWITNRDFFHRMASKPLNEKEEEVEVIEMGYNEANHLIERIHEKLNLPQLNYIPSISDFASVRFNPATYGGIISDKVLGAKTKGEAAKFCIHMAAKIFEKLKEGVLYSKSIYSVGAREKRENELAWGTILTSRGLLMPELLSILIGSCVSQPIEKEIHSDDESPMFLGKSPVKRGHHLIKAQQDTADLIYEGDWKGYDVSCSEKVMTLAMSVLRGCFPESEFIDNLFTYIHSEFCHKNVAVPGRYVYKLRKGLPSGHSFTALMGTAVNAVLLTDLIYNGFDHLPFKYSKNETTFHCAGDDFVVYFRRVIPKTSEESTEFFAYNRLSSERKKALKDEVEEILKKKSITECLSDYFLNKWGMKIKKGKDVFNINPDFPKIEDYVSKGVTQFRKDCAKVTDDAATFLKCVIVNSLPTVPSFALLERFITPNSMAKGKWREGNFLNEFSNGAGFLEGHNSWVCHLRNAWNVFSNGKAMDTQSSFEFEMGWLTRNFQDLYFQDSRKDISYSSSVGGGEEYVFEFLETITDWQKSFVEFGAFPQTLEQSRRFKDSKITLQRPPPYFKNPNKRTEHYLV